MRLFAMAFAAVAAAGATPGAAAECPSADDVLASVTRYITESYWSPSERETWRVRDVRDFRFGEPRFGRTNDIECPVRLDYSFTVEHEDGRVEADQHGPPGTLLFSRNAFDEWTFFVSPD